MSDTRRGQLLRAKLIEFIAAGDPPVTAHLEGLSDEQTSTCTAVWSPSAAAKGGKGRVAPHEYVAPLLAAAESWPMAGTPAWGWRRLHRRRRAFGWLPIFALVSLECLTLKALKIGQAHLACRLQVPTVPVSDRGRRVKPCVGPENRSGSKPVRALSLSSSTQVVSRPVLR
jgi:hypothetical protein